MRPLLATSLLALTLPLAGCFDADVSTDFTDPNAVEMIAVLTMGAEIYQMTASMGEDPCVDGVGVEQPDGTYACTMTESNSLTDLIAMQDDPENELGLGDGISIVDLGDDQYQVSFDLSDMFSELPPEEERAQMAAMFGDAFVGHGITITVVADEVLETNGQIGPDGDTATMMIPLEVMFAPGVPDMPESFDVTLVSAD